MFKPLRNLFGTDDPISCRIDRITDEKICNTVVAVGSFEPNNSLQGLLSSVLIAFDCVGEGDSSHSNASITGKYITIFIGSKSVVNFTKPTIQETSEELGLLREFNLRTTFDNEKPTEIKAAHFMIHDFVAKDLDVKLSKLVVVNSDEIIPKIRAHKKLLLEIHFDNDIGAVTAKFDLTGAAEIIDATLAKCLQIGTDTPSDDPIICERDRISGEKTCRTVLSKGFFEDHDSSHGFMCADIMFTCHGEDDDSSPSTDITIRIHSKSVVHLTKPTTQETSEEFGLVRFFNFRSGFDNGEPTEISAFHRMNMDLVAEDSDEKMAQLFVLNPDEIIPKIRAYKKMLLEIHFNTHPDGIVAEFDLTGVAEAIDATIAKCLQP